MVEPIRTHRGYAVGVLAIACLLVGAHPAAAQKRLSEAKRSYALGFKALRANKPAEALKHYKRSYRLTPRPRTLFNIAVCHEKLGDELEAFRAFRAFLAKAESRDANLVAHAKDRVTTLGRSLTGSLVVTSNPSGAAVRVDGNKRPRGRTPITLDLPPGEHLIRVSIAGAIPAERRVTVEPKQRSSLMVPLALASSVTIRAEPRDAVITRKGQHAVARGEYEANVRPGVYEFTIRRKGYVTEHLRVRAVAGRTYERDVRLRRTTTGASFILVGLGGARVTIDGHASASAGKSGRTDELEVSDVTPGEHEIHVSRSGHAPWRQRVHISPDEQVTVELDLAKQPTTRRKWLRWTAMGIGGVALGAGTILGVAAIQDIASDSTSRHDRAKSRSLMADGLFVVGIAAAVTVWRLSKSERSTARIRRSRRGAQ